MERAQSIFSVLGNAPTGFNSNLSSGVTFESETRFRLLSVNNGTLKSVKEGKVDKSQVSFSSTDFLEISEIEKNSFDLDFAGLQIEMKLDAEFQSAVGTKLQKERQLEVIDFREETTIRTATFTVNREASFSNVVGFFKVIDEEGGMDTDGDGTADVVVGDSNYIEAAIENRIASIDLSVENQTTATFTGEFEAGAIFVPFLIVDGTTEDFSDVFFPFLGANSDGVDHVMMLADNTFGFEDLKGGGDNDFNDTIIEMKFS